MVPMASLNVTVSLPGKSRESTEATTEAHRQKEYPTLTVLVRHDPGQDKAQDKATGGIGRKSGHCRSMRSFLDQARQPESKEATKASANEYSQPLHV